MKSILLILAICILASIKASSQLTLSTNYTFSKDKFFRNRIPLGIAVGYHINIGEKLFFHYMIESRFVRTTRPKSPYFYTNYEPWNINPSYLEIIKHKLWADREYKHFSLLLIPEFNLHYVVTTNNASITLSLFSGLNISLKVYDRYFVNYVFYSKDFTSFRLEDRLDFASRNIYGIYLPLGVYLQCSKLTFSLSYEISLKRKGQDSDWSGIEKRQNNFEIKLGYKF